MSTGLSYRERRVLQYDGQPAKRCAIAERMTVNEVLEVRAELRRRGVVPTAPETATAGTQLTFAAYDSLMRHNRSLA